MKTELTEDFTGCLAFLEGVAVLACTAPFFAHVQNSWWRIQQTPYTLSEGYLIKILLLYCCQAIKYSLAHLILQDFVKYQSALNHTKQVGGGSAKSHSSLIFNFFSPPFLPSSNQLEKIVSFQSHPSPHSSCDCSWVWWWTTEPQGCSALIALCLSTEVSAVESRCSCVGLQAAHSVHSQPQPEGCSQLWALPASLQRQGWEVPG